MTRNHRIRRGLYALTPDHLSDDDLFFRVEAALSGGISMLQYRDKIRPTDQKIKIAVKLVALCRHFNVPFIMNDSVEMALAVKADGVHLGKEDGSLFEARKSLGDGKILGASCYADFWRAQKAYLEGADYVAFGAVCSSPTKPHAIYAPLSLLRHCKNELPLPICAIGGITLVAAPEIIAAGADMLAVITDLFDAPDISARVNAYRQLFDGEVL